MADRREKRTSSEVTVDVVKGVPAKINAPLPARYDAMCRAIDAAFEIDEVKEYRDQALAFEVYSRQAKNSEAERRACEIRLRAERKAGELLRKQEKAKGAAGNPRGRGAPIVRSDDPTTHLPTLCDLGVSKQQSSDWQRLAEVPQEQFDTALADPDRKPTTAGIIAAGETEKHPERIPVSREAQWLWGRLKDFERNNLLSKNAVAVLQTMTPEMLDDVHRLAPQVANWLNTIGRSA